MQVEDNNINANKTLTCEQELNAKTVWGSVIYKLKTLNHIALYTACGEIRDVSFKNNVLIVAVKEDYLYNVIVLPENLNRIGSILKEIDKRIDVSVEKLSTKSNLGAENLNKLQSLFGKNLNT